MGEYDGVEYYLSLIETVINLMNRYLCRLVNASISSKKVQRLEEISK
jgi:hypothetical protein